jgi:hypothetical protein
MLTVLSGIAEFERDLILQRTNEGRMRAMAEGTRFGRKPKLTKHQAREALKPVAAGETLREIALSYNVDHSTICRLKARHFADGREHQPSTTGYYGQALGAAHERTFRIATRQSRRASDKQCTRCRFFASMMSRPMTDPRGCFFRREYFRRSPQAPVISASRRAAPASPRTISCWAL